MKLSTRIVAGLLLLLGLLWGISAETIFAAPTHQQSANCQIPPSGPWPACATGGKQPASAACVIPPSGPWPACATGGQATPSPAQCTIPPTGPWPACATGSGANAPTPATPSSPAAKQLTLFQEGTIDARYVAHQNGKTYFIHLDGNRNRTLWATDGTQASTKLVSQGAFSPEEIAPCQTALIIPTANATWSINQHGWLVKLADKRLRGGFDHNGSCYLWHGQGSIIRPGKHELWRTDGTPQGTEIIHTKFSGGGSYHSFTSAPNGQFMFAHTNNAGSSSTNDIMRSDGKSVTKVTNGWGIAGVTNNAIYTKWYGAKGSCGAGIAHAPDGTQRFRFSANTPQEIGTANNNLLFFATGNTCHHEPYYLWRSDGTEAGTVKLLRTDTSDGIAYNNYVYFARSSTRGGVELWRSNGTQAGTQFVKAIDVGQPVRFLHNFQIVDGLLYFTVDDGKQGQALWQSDGSGQNTKQIAAAIAHPHGEVTRPNQYTYRQITIVSDGKAVFYSVKAANQADQLWQLPLSSIGVPITPASSCTIPPTGPWPTCAR